MPQLKALHLASFAGNIGDQLNHDGFRPWLESHLASEVMWTNFEIREIYRQTKSFQDFINLFPKFDFVVIGGGNYFELWPENTSSGTSIDLTIEFLKNNKTPIFFNALGVDDGQGIGNAAKENFSGFIKEITSNSKYLLAVRNDGSAETLSRFVKDKETIHEIPDHGFFGLEPKQFEYADQSKTRIAINLAVDMAEKRFPGSPDASSFMSGFAEQLVRIYRAIGFVEFVFVPHVYSDLEAASQILKSLPDEIRRDSFKVGNYDASPITGLASFTNYDSSHLALTNRFHANVYTISRGIPTIGLSNYVQIERTLRPLLSPIVRLQEAKSIEDISSLAENALDLLEMRVTDRLALKNEAFESVRNLRQDFEPNLRSWISRNSINKP